MKRIILSKLGLGATLLAGYSPLFAQKSAPNIIVILADDLGYGDLSCYGGKQIETPNIDRIAKSGIRFTQGYATSATSTPSRYALMTGRYPWKNKDARVLPGDAPLLISLKTQTLPKIMQEAGYKTAAIGKWHLGLGNGNVDWNSKVSPNPSDIGYEYSYIQAATNDRVPCVYVENGYVDGLDPKDPILVSYKSNFDGEPTGKLNPEMLKMHPSHGHNMSIVNGVPRIGFMKGGKSALWVDETMAEVFLSKAKSFVEGNKNRPFFMYFGLHQPHVPRVPNEKFIGKSGMGPRGDAILEADWMVGELYKQLDELSLTENTIIVFSSDNGPVLDDGYKDFAVEMVGDHKPAGGLRGGKYSLFDGGTRVPFVISWPKIIKSGVSDAIVCQMDLVASFAKLVGVKITEEKDSEEILNTFIGKSKRGRSEIIIEGTRNLAYRQGDWVMIPPTPGVAFSALTGTETGRAKDYQLYNIKRDLHQDNNLAEKEAKILEKMKRDFEVATKGSTIKK